MAKEPRAAGLSRERIVQAAIDLLDELGENGLTFRALAARLQTGPGALYWHIDNKDQLLSAAAEDVVGRTLGDWTGGTPQQQIRELARVVFDLIDVHPWIGAELSRAPSEPATLRIYERIGRPLQALGVRRGAQFTAASTLLNYILGVSTQNAANARTFAPTADRTHFLEGVAARWRALDEQQFSFTRSVAAKLAAHDDRAEFLAGIDLILAGIVASS